MHQDRQECPACGWQARTRGEWIEKAMGRRPRNFANSDISGEEYDKRKAERGLAARCDQPGEAHGHPEDPGVQTDWVECEPSKGADGAWTREYRLVSTKIVARIERRDMGARETYHALFEVDGGNLAGVGDRRGRRTFDGARIVADGAAATMRDMAIMTGEGGRIGIHAGNSVDAMLRSQSIGEAT